MFAVLEPENGHLENEISTWFHHHHVTCSLIFRFHVSLSGEKLFANIWDVGKPIRSSLEYIESPLEFQEYFAEKKREEEKWKARMAIQPE